VRVFLACYEIAEVCVLAGLMSFSCSTYGLLTKCEVKIKLDIRQVSFFASLWTETESRSMYTQTPKRGQHIQPS